MFGFELKISVDFSTASTPPSSDFRLAVEATRRRRWYESDADRAPPPDSDRKLWQSVCPDRAKRMSDACRQTDPARSGCTLVRDRRPRA